MKDRCSPENLKSLRTKIQGIVEYAFREKIESYVRKKNRLIEIFQRIFFTFDEKKFTFSDHKKSEHPMEYLTCGTRLDKYDFIDPDDKVEIYDLVKKLVTLRYDIKNDAGAVGIDTIMRKISKACKERYEFIMEHGDLMRCVTGTYRSCEDQDALYYISNDPFDIFTKGTGRPWHVKYCERYTGQQEEGIYSDIAHNSSVIFIKDKRLKGFHSVLATMDLRLCIIDPKKTVYLDKYGLGWDINWYRGRESHDRYHIYKDERFYPLALTARQATKEIIEILRSKGFEVNYKTCTTPYVHEGYSDIEGGPKTKIVYQSKWKYRCRICGTPTKKEFYMKYDGMCKWHGTHPS